MTLAGMLALDRNALICDLAETYNIYDYKRVPVKTLGILAAGLRDTARIRQKAEGVKASIDTLILARILDVVSVLLWAQTKDAEHGRNYPDQFVKTFMEHEEQEPEHAAFRTGKEFEKARNAIIQKTKGAEQ